MSHLLSAAKPFTFLLFGASGHLAQIKLYPALYVLALKKRLPKNYTVVGFARTEMSDGAFRELVEKSVRTSMPEVTEKALKDFLSHIHYHAGQYDDPEDFRKLRKKLAVIEKGWGKSVRLAYLSVPPAVFPPIAKNLCKSGIHRAGEFRCIVEKPVGHDLQTADETWKTFIGCFAEEEIYLLDHYLGKEAVRNIYYLRSANPVLERLFKNTLIHHVEVTCAEHAGIEGRAGYFEHTGTLRDYVQSHALEMIALLTMRLGETDNSIKHNRLDALEQLYLPPAATIDDLVIQGQYSKGKDRSAKAYRDEVGVTKNSRTNTFIAMKLMSRTSRWEGVPFYLRCGKGLQKKETRISVQFQTPSRMGEGATSNRLDVILQGEAGMRFHLQTKLGGSTPAFRPLVLEDPLVCYGDCLPEHGLLLLEAIYGNRLLFLDFAEVRSAWKLLDPVQAYLDKPKTPLHFYPLGSTGPKEAEVWMGRNGVQWMNL